MLVKKFTQRDRVTTKYWLMCTYLPKDEIKALKEQVKALFDLMMESAEKTPKCIVTGYTHLQIAMPSSSDVVFSL
jgi:argininosuccinate lyase